MYTYKNEKDLESIQYGTNTIEYVTDENGQTTQTTLNGANTANFIWNKTTYWRAQFSEMVQLY